MITNIVLVVSLVILLCVITEKFSYKIGVPALRWLVEDRI